jgi:signal transduction histidine kinase
VGLRFTILYAVVFLLSGIALLAFTYLLSGGKVTVPALQQYPPDKSLAAAQERIRILQDQLNKVNQQHSRQLLIGSLLALLVMAVISLVLGRALAKRVLRPLRLITAATRRMSADNLDQRLGVSGPADEVKDLADTIDGLLQRLEASFAAQRRFVANASHELRTPMTTMRACLDVAVAKPDAAQQTLALANRLRPELDRVDQLLDGLLILARAQHGVPPGSASVDVAEVIRQALHDREDMIAATRLSVTSQIPLHLGTQGNVALISRMLDNIVDNAVVHNVEGGWITIRASEAGTDIRLVIETGGPVFAQRDVDRLARPFTRLGADRTASETGQGLGLSIADAIATIHNGRLDLTALPEGGLRVWIALPAVPA